MILILCLVGFLLLGFFFNVKAEVVIDTDICFVIDNETYKVNDTTRSFSKIVWTGSWILFNSTDFNVSSGNAITVSIDYINNSIIGAGDDDLVLEFCADTVGGTVYFNISGFRNDYNYTVKRNGTIIKNVTSNASGGISFNNSIWSEKVFEIYQGEAAEGSSTILIRFSRGYIAGVLGILFGLLLGVAFVFLTRSNKKKTKMKRKKGDSYDSYDNYGY